MVTRLPASDSRLLLYDYWRSSAAYRVRIALNLKGMKAEQVSVQLAKGEQRADTYKAVNPQGLVPALAVDDDRVLTQSLAIIEYLDEQHPEPALLPSESFARAHVRAMAYALACDVHPLNNLRVLKYLTGDMNLSDEQKIQWYHHWMAEGFAALEAMVAPHAGSCCYGDTPTLADICLIPQVYNAERFECALAAYPTLQRINAHCLTLPAFAQAVPEMQADAAL